MCVKQQPWFSARAVLYGRLSAMWSAFVGVATEGSIPRAAFYIQ
nr:MAG TPA: hypothetical protein [Caudoviricetes sp.]